jgi:outer membrane biogenesis lipoprotein LolB
MFLIALLVFSFLVTGCQSQAEKQQKQANDLANQAFGDDQKDKKIPSYTDKSWFQNQKK